MRVEGLSKLLTQLKDRTEKSKREDNVSVVVGYTAAYALYVHECIEMKLKGQPRRAPSKGFYWDPQGRAQAKFLETPARMYADVIRRIVINTYKMNNGNLAQALYMGGLYLQRESMQLVPVDTGNLKASAFTRVENEQEAD